MPCKCETSKAADVFFGYSVNIAFALLDSDIRTNDVTALKFFEVLFDGLDGLLPKRSRFLYFQSNRYLASPHGAEQ